MNAFRNDANIEGQVQYRELLDSIKELSENFQSRHNELLEGVKELSNSVQEVDNSLLKVLHAIQGVAVRIECAIDKMQKENELPDSGFYRVLSQWCKTNKSPSHLALVASTSLQVRQICLGLQGEFPALKVLAPDMTPSDMAAVFMGLESDAFLGIVHPEYWAPSSIAALNQAITDSSITISIDKGQHERDVTIQLKKFRAFFVTCNERVLLKDTAIVWPQSRNPQKGGAPTSDAQG